MKTLSLKVVTWAQARRATAHESGQTVIEYALVVALVSIVLAGLLVGFGTAIINWAQGVAAPA
jgi:Flp pilus assembly pilin Flp